MIDSTFAITPFQSQSPLGMKGCWLLIEMRSFTSLLTTLTVDADVDARGQGVRGGDGPVVDVTLVLHAVILLPGNDLKHADSVRVLVRGPGEVGHQGDVTQPPAPGDVRSWGASFAGAAEHIGLALHRLDTGLGDGGGPGGEQHRDAHRHRVQLHPSAVLLDATLEPPVVPVIVGVGEVQIISALAWLVIHPKTQEDINIYNTFLCVMKQMIQYLMKVGGIF